MKSIIHIIFLFLFYHCTAQNAKEDFARVSKAYHSAQTFSSEVMVRVYKDKNDVSGNALGRGLIRKSGNNYYSKFLSDEMIRNTTCTILVDHKKKQIIYFKATPENQEKTDLNYLPQMDSLLKHNDSLKYRGTINGIKQYSIYSKGPVIRTDVYLDGGDFRIKKIVNYYPESNKQARYGMFKVMIDYENQNVGPINNTFFSEQKYIKTVKGKPSLRPEYAEYELAIVGDKSKIQK